MPLDEKIIKIASLLFALMVMGVTAYFVLTVKWFVYALAFSNIMVLGLLFFLVSKEIIETWNKKTED